MLYTLLAGRRQGMCTVQFSGVTVACDTRAGASFISEEQNFSGYAIFSRHGIMPEIAYSPFS